VLRLAHLMAETAVEISDEFFARLQEQFNGRQLEGLASAIAWENYLARSNRVFRIESDGFSRRPRLSLVRAPCPLSTPVRRKPRMTPAEAAKRLVHRGANPGRPASRMCVILAG